MASITQGQFAALLQGLSRSNIISLTAVTDPDMRRRNNPFCTQDGRRWISHVRKVSILSGGLINCSFRKMVDAQRLREHVASVKFPKPPKRRSKGRLWGKHVSECPLIRHVVAGELRLYLHVRIRYRYDHFFDNRSGERIPEAKLASWLNERDTGYENQGLDSPVIVKDWKLENCAEITVDKCRYNIAPAVTELARYLNMTPTTTMTKTKSAAKECRRKTSSSKKTKGAM